MIKKLRRRLAVVFTAFTGVVLAVVIGISLWYSVQQVQYNSQIYFSIASSEVVSYLAYVNGEDSSALTAMEEQQKIVIAIESDDGPVEFAHTWQPKTNRDILVERAQALVDETGAQYSGDMLVQFSATPVYVAVAEAAPTESHSVTSVLPGTLVEDDSSGAENGVAVGESYAISLNAFSFIEFSMGSDLKVKGEYGDSYRCGTMSCRVEGKTYNITILQDLAQENQGIALLCLAYSLVLLAGVAAFFGINWFLARMVIKPTAQGIQRQADFVAAASHELRNPLAVIRSSLGAAKAAKTDAQAEKYQNAADSEAERMGRLVDDLLLLAGGDAGSWKLTSRPVDVDTLLIETAEQYTPIVKEKGLTLALELPENTLGEIKGDNDRLRQILGVLLDNAMEYAPEKSELTLRATSKKNKVEIEVADKGKGIKDEEKERVFERFYRADRSRTGKEHFGLGLSVAKELAALHGGSLVLKDTAGGGATFVLVLPRAGTKEDKPDKKQKRPN